MTTEREIRECFATLRDEIKIAQDTQSAQSRQPLSARAVDENRTVTNLVEMGLFILESFFLDIKRIADAQTGLVDIARTDQARANEYDGK